MEPPNSVAVFPVEVARELLATYRKLQASGLIGPARIEDALKRLPTLTETPIYVFNVSGEAIPPYACMQVTGTVEEGGQNYLEVDKPADDDGSSGTYLFNGHNEIEIDGKGIAQVGRVVRGIKSTGTATAGTRWKPVVADWDIVAGATGQFIMAGEDDIATDVVRIFCDAGACC